MNTLKPILIPAAVLSFILSSTFIPSFADDSADTLLKDSPIIAEIKMKQSAEPLLKPFKISANSDLETIS